MSWKKDMLWGAASAAYQIEGAYNEDGRGMSIWDSLSDGHVVHGDNGNIACDSYHRFEEDIALMKNMGIDAYRFSISWPRIVPKKGMVNEKGIAYYNRLVDELLKNGIRPMVTLYHWDLPMWLHEEKGWYSEAISEYFAEYTGIVVDALSDRVTDWMTMNEAATFVGAGYLEGIHAPFEKVLPGSDEFNKSVSVLTKNVLLAHGKAVRIIREHSKQPAKIGIAMDGWFYRPKNLSEEAMRAAAERTFVNETNCHRINWWLDPIVFGKANGELAKYISKEEMAIISQEIDFVGYNCYKSNDLDDDNGQNPEVTPGIPRTAMGWAITEDALYYATKLIYGRYKLPILITENGMANVDFVMSDGKVHDPQRIEYLKLYLEGLKKAADEDIPIIGYMYWSIMDNFEWAEGYDKRFGLIHVDYKTGKRTPKDSYYWYADYIKEQRGGN